MKKIILILAVTVGAFVSTNAQTVTPYLQINLDKTQLSGVCNLGGASTVYLHSGLGSSSATAIWENIVGNWGLKDSIGLMTTIDTSHFSICFNVRDYYTNLASPDSLHGGQGLGPLKAANTPYNIGLVFRGDSCWADGHGKFQCIEGKDQTCKDLFLLELPSGSPYCQNQAGDPFPAVTAKYVSACSGGGPSGVKDLSSQLKKDLSISPNPVQNSTKITFNMIPWVTEVTLEIFDINGKKVADLTPAISAGFNNLNWNATGLDGNVLSPGLYIIKASNGKDIYTKKFIKE